MQRAAPTALRDERTNAEMDCSICSESRISYTAPDGTGRTARLSYRCAVHATEHRQRDAAVRQLAALITRVLPLALPAPLLQLTNG